MQGFVASYQKDAIPTEAKVKAKAFFAIFFAGALVVAYPQWLLAEKTQKQYKHAAESLRRGDLETAEREFEEILRKKPEYQEAKILLSLTHFQLGEKAKLKGDRAHAISEWREALRLEPDEAYWHSALANLLNEQGDAEGAAKECAQAAQLSPDDSGLSSGCGLKASSRPEEKGNEPGDNEGGAGSEVFKIGGDVSPPRPTHRPEPPYSQKARMVQYEGTTVLLVVVNSRGDVEQERVVKPLGLGLDQNALRTMHTWKFTPAMRKGTPVSVRVRVEITFRLF